MPRHLRRMLRLLIIAAVLFVTLSGYFAYKLTSPRPRSVGAAPENVPAESITLVTNDKHTLAGWYLPADKSDTAVVLLHGYGGDRRQMLSRAKRLRELGHAALLYDARACGESEGTCISFGRYETEDLLAALDFVKQRGAKRIACLGVSQGGATILLAAERLPSEVRCVICESAFDQLDNAIDNRFRRYTLLPGRCAGCLLIPLGERRIGVSIDDIRPVDHIAKLRCPIFIISGQDDEKTTVADTQRLFAAAPTAKELWLIPGAGHRDLASQDGYWDKVTAFLAKHLAAGE